MHLKHIWAGLLFLGILSNGAPLLRLEAQPAAPSRIALTGAVSQQAAAFGISRAVTELEPEPAVADTGTVVGRDRVRLIRNPRVRGENPLGTGDEFTDLATQTLMPDLTMPAPILSFEGLSSQDNANVFGFQVLPPDTIGDVGPNHYVQQTNLLVRVFDKAGVPVTLPFRLSSLFASGGVCQLADRGDPVVMYDPLADRWILSQFGFTAINTPPYHQCIAISRTSNPAGAYFLYDFVTPGNEFPDYPKLGVWPDAYYMTVNQFTNGNSFNGTGAYAFDRAKMLMGDPSATFNYFNLNLASHPEAIGGALPSDLDGLRPPAAGAPNVFSYFLATEFFDAIDGLRLFNFHADFVSPALATFTERAESPLPVAAFNPTTGGQGVSQPGTATGLDPLADRLMNRLQYRNTGAAETLVVTHNVDADSSIAAFRAGVRYYELRRSGGAYSVNEQATFSPDTTHRWMGSAATDHTGNLAVGYSASSSTVFPGIRFAGRLASDPPGGLFQGESLLTAGSGRQTHSSGRWGDYSALTVDPIDDCTFFHTTEYYQTTSVAGWQTRVGSFKYPSCSAAPRGTIVLNLTNCATAADIANALVTLDGVLYGLTSATGDLTAAVVPGTYTLAASSAGSSASTSVTATAGATTNVNLCIGSSPNLVVSNLGAPGKSAAGATISVKDTTTNTGSGGAGPSTTRFFFSTDAVLSGGDPVLGNRAVPALAAGAFSAGATSVTIPPATTAGLYFIIAKADGPNALTETDETDNIRTKKISIGPDLRVTLLSAPASATRGTSIAVSHTTKNTGGAPTGAATVTRFYLSTDSTVDAGDVVLGSRSIPALPVNGTDSSVITVAIPATTVPGLYRIIAVADATTVVAESLETNNKKLVSITINP